MRSTYSARLVGKRLLSEVAQCFHLEFVMDELDCFLFEPGQFVSFVATDASGKEQTRAYSLASAPSGKCFDLCVNRVENGFFSNLLCDLAPGDVVSCHGPHGTFSLREPLTESLLIATGTGIAPMRGFTQWLFPGDGVDRSQGRAVWLIYGTRYEADIYYKEYFEQIAATYPNFRYLPSLSRAGEDWTGLRGYVQEHAARLLGNRSGSHAIPHSDLQAQAARPAAAAGAAPGPFDIHGYICGLNEMVAASRECLRGLGWHRKQVVFERYD